MKTTTKLDSIKSSTILDKVSGLQVNLNNGYIIPVGLNNFMHRKDGFGENVGH